MHSATVLRQPALGSVPPWCLEAQELETIIPDCFLKLFLNELSFLCNFLNAEAACAFEGKA